MVRGPQCMLGYLNNEKANSETFDKDGWMKSGNRFTIISSVSQKVSLKVISGIMMMKVSCTL